MRHRTQAILTAIVLGLATQGSPTRAGETYMWYYDMTTTDGAGGASSSGPGATGEHPFVDPTDGGTTSGGTTTGGSGAPTGGSDGSPGAGNAATANEATGIASASAASIESEFVLIAEALLETAGGYDPDSDFGIDSTAKVVDTTPGSAVASFVTAGSLATAPTIPADLPSGVWMLVPSTNAPGMLPLVVLRVDPSNADTAAICAQVGSDYGSQCLSGGDGNTYLVMPLGDVRDWQSLQKVNPTATSYDFAEPPKGLPSFSFDTGVGPNQAQNFPGATAGCPYGYQGSNCLTARDSTIGTAFKVYVEADQTFDDAATYGVRAIKPVTETGGTAPYAVTVTGLPTGVTAAEDGSFSGVTTMVGEFHLVFTIADSTGAVVTVNRYLTLD